MPTYVALTKWTDQGIKSAKGAVNRAEQGRAAVEQAGGRVVGLWWTQGAYDAVLVVDWPDDESATVFALSYAATGNVRTETMRAYTNEEMQRILSSCPDHRRCRAMAAFNALLLDYGPDAGSGRPARRLVQPHPPVLIKLSVGT